MCQLQRRQKASVFWKGLTFVSVSVVSNTLLYELRWLSWFGAAITTSFKDIAMTGPGIDSANPRAGALPFHQRGSPKPD